MGLIPQSRILDHLALIQFHSLYLGKNLTLRLMKTRLNIGLDYVTHVRILFNVSRFCTCHCRWKLRAAHEEGPQKWHSF